MTPTLALATALLTPLASPPTSGGDDFEDFGGELDRIAASIPLPGYSAAIVRDGELAWTHAWRRWS